MTGFGLGEVPLGSGRLGVEIRGVNHRFLDVRVRVPRELGELAGFVEQVAREKLTRGRYEVVVRVEGAALGQPVLDRDRARAAFKALSELRDEVAPGSEVPLQLLAAIPDLFTSAVDREIDVVREATRSAFGAATTALDAMRSREGAALHDDLVRRLDQIRRLARAIAQRSPEVLEAHRKRLRERAERLRVTAELDLDGSRLEQEVAVFAERSDISEELTRLESHCSQVASLFATDEAIGRRLDFLLQEMAREANTVGAKSPD
ncbi:MAG TPA: YicC/YloC family endoribonuclease, partial [Polyangiaceae bacterium]|nr:YicC/YloC family endoribonuclease [Polyangiaceae bacterium]